MHIVFIILLVLFVVRQFLIASALAEERRHIRERRIYVPPTPVVQARSRVTPTPRFSEKNDHFAAPPEKKGNNQDLDELSEEAIDLIPFLDSVTDEMMATFARRRHLTPGLTYRMDYEGNWHSVGALHHAEGSSVVRGTDAEGDWIAVGPSFDPTVRPAARPKPDAGRDVEWDGDDLPDFRPA